MSDIDDLLEEEEGSGWIATFADMVTLLLVFFILLYSLSELDVGKFKKAIASIQNSLRGELAVQLGLTEFVPPAPPAIVLDPKPASTEEESDDKEKDRPKTDEEKTLEEIKEFIFQHDIDAEVGVQLSGKKLIIRVKDKGLFRAGQAQLQAESEELFSIIYELFMNYPSYNVNIKGHTDNAPISTVQFPSNWELSAIRATSVLRYFINKGVIPARLTATGYGDIIPLVPNDNQTNRALNRRVEFVLEKDLTDEQQSED
jgi:chemotaxis protein MotB